jgi:hypothetical protein
VLSIRNLRGTSRTSALPSRRSAPLDAAFWIRVAANGDTQQARLKVENWFNSSLDRVSGWYKSRTQKILFCIGLLATVVVNADSISMFRNLLHSKNLQAVVGAAQRVAGEKPASGQDAQSQISKAMDQLNGLDLGIGWASERDQPGPLDRDKVPPTLAKDACNVETWPCQDPIGWTFHLLYLHGIGWLITTAAISLGAPFWFDTLNGCVANTLRRSDRLAVHA